MPPQNSGFNNPYLYSEQSYIENILRQMPFLNLMPMGNIKLADVVKYINEVKNPYYFKVGKVKVRVSYADTDRTLDDAFANLLRIKFM